MSFPQDLPLATHVTQAREQRLQELSRATLRAMGLRGLLIAVELAGFYLFASRSLLMDALASCLDLLVSILLLGCLQTAKAPPDSNHPFGHGRLEPVCGLLTGVMLIQAGLYLAYGQGSSLSQMSGSVDLHACLFALAATALMEGSYRLLHHYASKHDSPALAAEAAHYRLDALNSLIAFAAIAASYFLHEHGAQIDALGALLIAMSMTWTGYRVSKQNFDQLVDRKPASERFSAVREAALEVEGVLGTEKIRIQQYGPDAHVDIDIELEPGLRVDAAHRISQRVRRAIQERWPAVRDVTVHIEPHYRFDHLEQ